MILAFVIVFVVSGDSQQRVLVDLRGSVLTPHPVWHFAVLSGLAYGLVAFFSVFIFMFKGRTATFAGLVNRLTSLLAGTSATLLFALFFGGKWPSRIGFHSASFWRPSLASRSPSARTSLRRAELRLSQFSVSRNKRATSRGLPKEASSTSSGSTAHVPGM